MSLNYDKLVGFLKKNPEASQKAAAESQNLSIGEVSMLRFCQAKVEAGVVSKAPGTNASIKKLRDSEGDRWEMIAARTGKSVADVKAAYEEAGGNAASSYIGRGRNPNGAQTAKPKASGKKPAAKAATGRKAAGTGKKPVIVRNRRGRAGNPS